MTDHHFDIIENASRPGPVQADSPLAIWRRKTSLEITQSDLTDVRDRLAIFAPFSERYWTEAVAGDVAAAIHIGAKAIYPSLAPGPRLDLSMSLLLACSITGSTAVSLMLAVGLEPAVDGLVPSELASSWLAWAMYPNDPVRALGPLPLVRQLGAHLQLCALHASGQHRWIRCDDGNRAAGICQRGPD
jgi:hypothetical protein